MMKKPLRVLILGGFGYFGARLAERLRGLAHVEVLTAGRQARLDPDYHRIDAESAELGDLLVDLRLDVLVVAIGPVTGRSGSYRLARAAIEAGVHYIDLADGREHVVGVRKLDREAREAGVMVTSGASSVPALSSAVIDHLLTDFANIEHLEYGISASELTPGIDAIRSALRYCGQPLRTGYGWQGGRWKKFYSPLGRRWLLRCDVPDLDLMPERYGLKEIHFRAGVAGMPHMLALWSLSWLVRLGLVDSIESLAPILQTVAKRLERFGSGRSGMYVRMTGRSRGGQSLTREWQLIAESNDGPYVPALAAVALIRKLTSGSTPFVGARPCIGLLNLADLKNETAGLSLRWKESCWVETRWTQPLLRSNGGRCEDPVRRFLTGD